MGFIHIVVLDMCYVHLCTFHICVLHSVMFPSSYQLIFNVPWASHLCCFGDAICYIKFITTETRHESHLSPNWIVPSVEENRIITTIDFGTWILVKINWNILQIFSKS